MSHTAAPAASYPVVVADLLHGDVILSGHGFGAEPVMVDRIARFTGRVSVVVPASGRVFNLRSGAVVRRASRVGEGVSGPEDCETACDSN